MALVKNIKVQNMDMFICHVVPNEFTKKLHASQAGNNFCWKLINGNCFNMAISIVPISYNIKSCLYDNVLHLSSYGRNKLLSYVKLFKTQLDVALHARLYDRIWFYNIWYLDFITYIICRVILKKQVYVIFADNTPTKRILSFENLFFYLIGKANGVISLSGRTNLIHNNNVVLPGIIEEYRDEHPVTSEPFNVLFSGTITDYTGAELLQRLIESDYGFELYVSGINNSNIDFSKYPNVHYLGFTSYEDYLTLLSSANVCLSLRDPKYPENQNNFPSKILEYLSYNKVVLSTMDYPELEGWEYVVCDYELDSLLEKLSIIKETYSDYSHLKNKERVSNLCIESWKDNIKKIETYA